MGPAVGANANQNYAKTMPPQKGGNPFGMDANASASHVSPSPARTSVKSGGYSEGRMSAGKAGRSVSFAGGAKPGSMTDVAESASSVAAVCAERVAWQAIHS